jgi:hypothetical protein
MTWSYDPTQLGESQVYQVRLKIGDTDTSAQQLQDEEIQYWLDSEVSVDAAAYQAALALAGKYTRKVDKAVGDLKISYSKIAQQYKDLAEVLMSKNGLHQIPTAGGIYVDEQTRYENNEALRHNAIKRGMHDYVRIPNKPNVSGS